MKTLLILLTALLALINTTFAQDGCETEIRKLIATIDGPKGQKMKVGERIEVCNTIIEQSLACDFNEGLSIANFSLAQIYFVEDPEKSRWHLTKVDSIIKEDESLLPDENKAAIKVFEGRVHGRLGNPVLEIESYFAASEIAESKDLKQLQAYINQLLSRYYIDKKQFERAKIYSDKAISYHSKRREIELDDYSYLTLLRNRGIAHCTNGQPDSCVYYLNRCIDEGFGKYSNLSISYMFLGKSYLMKQDVSSAQKYIQLAEQNFDTTRLEERSYGDFMALKASYQYELKDYDLATGLYKQANDVFKLTLDFKGQEEATLGILSANLSSHGRSDLVDQLKEMIALKDSLYNVKVLAFERQLMIQLETNIKEAEIARLSEENLNRKYQTLLIVTVSVIALLTFLIILLRVRAKRKRLSTQLEQEKLSRKIAASELDKSMESLESKAKLIDQLKQEIESQDVSSIAEMSSILDKNYVDDAAWAAVKLHFEKLHGDFMQGIYSDYPQLKPNDMRLLILINLGYSNKGISIINNITESGVKKAKQRLRQKMGVEEFPMIGSK